MCAQAAHCNHFTLRAMQAHKDYPEGGGFSMGRSFSAVPDTHSACKTNHSSLNASVEVTVAHERMAVAAHARDTRTAPLHHSLFSHSFSFVQVSVRANVHGHGCNGHTSSPSAMPTAPMPPIRCPRHLHRSIPLALNRGRPRSCLRYHFENGRHRPPAYCSAGQHRGRVRSTFYGITAACSWPMTRMQKRLLNQMYLHIAGDQRASSQRGILFQGMVWCTGMA